MKNWDFRNITYILLDIEGTTSDIRFVKDVLFPYSAQNVENFLQEHPNKSYIENVLERLEVKSLAEATLLLQKWIAEDKKHPVLKELQGQIWQKGFQTKQFEAPLYPDVLPAIKKWQAAHKTIGIYSSGSVQAQKLFFTHTTQGDLTPYFSHYFDLQVGSKKDPESYKKIAETVQVLAPSILFLSDVPEELLAAQRARLQTLHVCRPGTPPSDLEDIETFEEIE